MIRPRKVLEDLKKYVPPLEGRGGKLRLDFNENTVGCAPEVVRALHRCLNSEMLTRYPEYKEGRQKLARYFKVSPDELVLTNGTDDAIKLICETFVEPGDTLLVPAPTFPVYQFFHEVAGGRVVRVYHDESFNLPLDELLAALKKKVRWVAIANPNNPTGTTVPKDHLRAMLEAAPATAFVVDEAYYEFAGETVLPWIRKYPNLIVTRTFSKAFGLAALRLGCAFTNPKTADDMRRGQNPFPVNSLALAAALAAIQHASRARRYAKEVRANRAVFCRWLKSFRIPFVPSLANFVLTRVGSQAAGIAKRLRDKGILVRDWSYDPRLQGYLRITIGSAAQNRRLIEELTAMKDLIETRQGKKDGGKFTAYSSTRWLP